MRTDGEPELSKEVALERRNLRPLGGLLVLSLAASVAVGQDAKASKDAAGLRTGPATVASHWSKYKYPDSIPEGASYHIVEKGDTLWDLSKRYLNNAYLWPQIWDKNRYITDAHWIYPGDPILLPNIAVVSDHAGTADAGGAGDEGMTGTADATAGDDAATRLYQVSEEATMRCASYIVNDSEDDSFKIMGTELGIERVSFADREIIYLSKGTNAGVKVGDVFTAHHAAYKVKHPISTRAVGTKVETTGWVRVLLVQESSATAIVEQACLDMHAGDYLKPFEKVNVPLLRRQAPPDRMTPPSGKANGYVIDAELNKAATGAGDLITVDLGSGDGVAPGTRLTVFRTTYPTVPTPRVVIGELAILRVAEKTSLAKVIYSRDGILIGDHVELR
jgi:hypothetical protein